MKKYKVNVNGTEYEVCVELIGDDGRAPAQVASTVTVPTQTATPTVESAAPAQTANNAAAGDGEPVKAPLQGTILAVNISAGDSVKKGDVVMVLEAMKMENEIMAPKAGTVTQVVTSKGASVSSGDPLVVIG